MNSDVVALNIDPDEDLVLVTQLCRFRSAKNYLFACHVHDVMCMSHILEKVLGREPCI